MNGSGNIMRLRCRHLTETGDPANPYEECDKLAKAMILTLADPGQPFTAIEAQPLCEGHAPEEAHETASSLSDDEYLMVELPVFGLGFLQ